MKTFLNKYRSSYINYNNNDNTLIRLLFSSNLEIIFYYGQTVLYYYNTTIIPTVSFLRSL